MPRRHNFLRRDRGSVAFAYPLRVVRTLRTPSVRETIVDSVEPYPKSSRGGEDFR